MEGKERWGGGRGESEGGRSTQREEREEGKEMKRGRGGAGEKENSRTWPVVGLEPGRGAGASEGAEPGARPRPGQLLGDAAVTALGLLCLCLAVISKLFYCDMFKECFLISQIIASLFVPVSVNYIVISPSRCWALFFSFFLFCWCQLKPSPRALRYLHPVLLGHRSPGSVSVLLPTWKGGSSVLWRAGGRLC